MTNAQKLRKLAKEIDYNPLAFAFVLDSCMKMQKMLDDASDEQREAFANGLVSYEAWKAAGDTAVAILNPSE